MFQWTCRSLIPYWSNEGHSRRSISRSTVLDGEFAFALSVVPAIETTATAALTAAVWRGASVNNCVANRTSER